MTTLLALVPLLALVISVAKGFDLQRPALDYLRRLLSEFIAAGQQDVVDTVLAYVNNTNLSTLGGLGLALLAYAAVSLMGTIERAFNNIWAVTGGRPLHRRVIDYIGLLVVLPVLLLASSGLTATLGADRLIQRMEQY